MNSTSTFRLTLFITGGTSTSQTAVRNLQNLCSRWHDAAYELEVVDVLEQPERAEASKIIATPTLVRRTPEPVRRVIGDLGDLARVVEGLDLHALTQTGPGDFQRDGVEVDPRAGSRNGY